MSQLLSSDMNIESKLEALTRIQEEELEESEEDENIKCLSIASNVGNMLECSIKNPLKVKILEKPKKLPKLKIMSINPIESTDPSENSD